MTCVCETAVLLLAVLTPIALSISVVEEVQIGDTAVLKCPSNDDNHRFQFWQLTQADLTIGPKNTYDRNKYKYEVLSGNLTIRGVSSGEHGLYTCVSKHIRDNTFSSKTVELVVNRDWEEVYETDPMTNVFRVVLLVAVLLVLLVLLLILYNVSTDRSARFRALDEESPEEPGPSHSQARSFTSDNRLPEFDSHVLDTELPRPPIFMDVRLTDSTI